MIIDQLLRADLEEIKAMPQGEVYLPRFEEKYGSGNGTIKVQGISADELEEINEFNKKHDESNGIDQKKATLDLVVRGTVDPNIRDSRLLEKFHTMDPADIVKAIFLPGEIIAICEQIIKLSGLDKEKYAQAVIDKTIKN